MRQPEKKQYKTPFLIKILSVVCGVGFVAYYLVQGWEFVTAVLSGIVCGGLALLGLTFVYGLICGAAESGRSTVEKFNKPERETKVVDHKEFRPTEKVERKEKGYSMVRIPRHYTVVDTETTGLDPQRDRIIEIAAIRVRAGKEVARFETLVKPGRRLSKKIVELTGITDADLKDAPKQSEALQKFQEFLRDDVIVAHNAHFDVNFLYDSFQRCELPPLKNNFVDTLRLAKCIRPELDNYKLATLAEDYKIPQPTAHRALADCETTMAVLQKLSEDIDQQSIDLTQYQKFGYDSPFKVSEVTAEPDHEKPENPLYGKCCVFTGELESMTRLEAAQLVVNIGGTCRDKVTKKTNYLIVGKDECHIGANAGKSAKELAAEELIEQGMDLHILTEKEFLSMLSE